MHPHISIPEEKLDPEEVEEQYWHEYFSDLEFCSNLQESIKLNHGPKNHHDKRFVFETRPFGFTFCKTRFSIARVENGSQAGRLGVRRGFLIVAVNGENPTYDAIKHSRVPVTIDCQFPPEMKLIFACQSGDIELVKKLLDLAVDDINKIVQAWKTPLICASNFGHLEITKLLLKRRKKADPNITNSDGQTATMYASLQGHEKILDLLIKYKADVNTQDMNGYTALMMASEGGLNSVEELLLNSGADPQIKNADSKTADDIRKYFKTLEEEEDEIRANLETCGRYQWEYKEEGEWKEFEEFENEEIERLYRTNQIKKLSGRLFHEDNCVRRMNFGAHTNPEQTEKDVEMATAPTTHDEGIANVQTLVFYHDKSDGQRYILVQKRRESASMTAAGVLSFPAGRVENNEKFTEAAVREVYEESHIAIDESCLRFLSSRTYDTGELRRFYCVIDDNFIGRGSHVHENAHFGHFGHKWMSLKEVQNIPSTPSTKSRHSSADWKNIENREGRRAAVPIEGKLFFLPSDNMNIKKARKVGAFGNQ